MEHTITSYIIGEGIRATTTGNYTFDYTELDEAFNLEPGSVKDMSHDIEQCLLNCPDIVADVELTDEEIDVVFYLKYCPYYIEEKEED